MTLIVCKLSERGVDCYADGRLSNNGISLFDAAAKIFIVPIKSVEFRDGKEVQSGNHSLGFAYSGSSLLAVNTHAIASTCTQMLNKSTHLEMPSVAAIASIYAQIGNYVINDYDSKQKPGITHQLIRILIFGYCLKNNNFEIYELLPENVNGKRQFVSKRVQIGPNSMYSMGSGDGEFNKFLEERKLSGNAGGVGELFSAFINKNAVASVGGRPQFGHADKNGMVLMPLMGLSPTDLSTPEITMLGFNLSTVSDIEDFAIGYEAVSIDGDVQRMTLNKELVRRGFAMDCSQEIKNTICVEQMFRYAIAQKSGVVWDEKYTLRSIIDERESGKCYLDFKCNQCGFVTPICCVAESPSEPVTVTGVGVLNTSCRNCNSKASTPSCKIILSNYP